MSSTSSADVPPLRPADEGIGRARAAQAGGVVGGRKAGGAERRKAKRSNRNGKKFVVVDAVVGTAVVEAEAVVEAGAVVEGDGLLDVAAYDELFSEDDVAVEGQTRRMSELDDEEEFVGAGAGGGPKRAQQQQGAQYDAGRADASVAEVDSEAESQEEDAVEIDVEAVSSIDEAEARQKELVKLLDAALLLVEMKVGSAREVIERTAAVEAATHSSDAPSQWKLLNNLSPELREKRMKALDAEAVLTDAVSKSLDRE